MKSLPTITFVAICTLFFACQHEAQEADYLYRAQGGAQRAQAAAPVAQHDPIEMKPVRDAKTGRTMSYIPLPKSWQQITDAYGNNGYDGPNGIQVRTRPTEVYYFNMDPYVAQMTGKQLANPIPLQTIFQQNIAPAIRQQGGTLIQQYPLQEVAQVNQQMIQSALSRSRLQSYQILASEWEQPSGHKSLILISHMIIHGQGSSSWGLGFTELEAPARSFEQAKKTYVFGISNVKADRNTAMAHAADLNRIDREGQQRMANSRAAHQARMRSNEAAFQATQRAHTSSSNDILDMGMQGYQDRAASQDRLRRKETNMIYEEYTVTNPWDNRSMQVESGYQKYYINAQGDVIGSNNPNFDPNVHNNYNHTEWKPMPRQQ